MELCENRESWIRNFPCGKFQIHQKASDWTTYETTVVAVKENSILMFLMSGWPSHISKQLDALKMILFITAILVFLSFLSALQNFPSEAQGQISWQRLFLAFSGEISLAFLHTWSQCRISVMVWSFSLLISFLWTLVAATGGYRASKTAYFSLVFYGVKPGCLQLSVVTSHDNASLSCSNNVYLHHLIHCNPWLLFRRPCVWGINTCMSFQGTLHSQ